MDFGCFAPLNAFLRVFGEQGVDITYKQAREPMGLLKIEHIKAILRMPEVNRKFREVHGRDWTLEDVDVMYGSFERHLFASLEDFTTPLPGVVDTMGYLRGEGVKIGSTTGYTSAMMDVVRPGAAAKGYMVDNLVTPDHLPAGRPAPYMIYRNMIDLAVDSVDAVVKVGDTIADIREGVNAKAWSVGIITGSNELGLNEEEYNAMSADRLAEMKREVAERMRAAGANAVLDNITELPDYIARTDSSGNFRLTNLREGHYRVMAIEDANRDKMYTPESEMFAWMDTTVFPVVEPATRVDTFHVIEKIVEADTILRDSIVRTDYLAYGPSNLYLRLFLERLTQLYMVEDDRKEREQLNFIFSIPGENGLEVTLWDTLATEPLPQDWYFKEHSAGNDTLTLWIKDSTVYKKDTLNVILSYMRSDSTGQWERYSDTARYTFRAKEKKEGKSKKKDEDAPKVEFLEIKSNISGDLDLGARLYLEFSRPINKSTLDSIRVLEKVDTVYQLIPFQVVEDSLRVRRVFVDAAWKAGGEYQLQIDSATIYDIYGRFNDKLEKKFKVRTEEYYGKIMVNVRGVDCPTIVQLYKAENGKSENG